MNGNGYDGYSMSNNARSAYSRGEMPISRWSKGAVINAIAAEIGVSAADIKLKKPFREYLVKTSYHHTGSKYSKTDFYSVRFTDDEVTVSAEAQARLKAELRAEMKRVLADATEKIKLLKAWKPEVTEDSECFYIKDAAGEMHTYLKSLADSEKAIAYLFRKNNEAIAEYERRICFVLGEVEA